MKSRIIKLPHFKDYRGSLTVAELSDDLPFEVKRAFWTYDVPDGKSRGAHAHKQLRELLIAISGSFTVNVDDGMEQKAFFLDNPYTALLIEPGEWSSEDFFSPGAVCLVLCDDHYDVNDYIRDYNDYIAYIRSNTP